jgi:hypothetical protein
MICTQYAALIWRYMGQILCKTCGEGENKKPIGPLHRLSLILRQRARHDDGRGSALVSSLSN